MPASTSHSSVYTPNQRNTLRRDPFEDDDEPELIDLTQRDDAGPALELYGSLDNKVVGVRFYNGVISSGEVVLLKREPSNPYDSNAIRVDNVANVQVGHLPRKLAEKLVPYVDAGQIMMEGGKSGPHWASLVVR